MSTLAESGMHNGAVSCTQEPQSTTIGTSAPSSKFGLSERGYKLCMRVELVVLCVLIAVVWGLLAIPLFIFYLSDMYESDLNNVTEVVRGSFLVSNTGQPESFNISVCPYNCSHNFYCREGVVCVPSCDWKVLSDELSDTIDILLSLLLATSELVGIIALIISFIRRKKMFTFPSVLVVYHNITWLVFGMVMLVSVMGRNALFCPSGDLIESILTSTGWCVFSGVMFYYCLLQLMTWWICHVSVLFWKIKNPLQARSFDKSTRVHYIHIACIVFSLLVPLIPVLVIMGNNLDDSLVGTVGFTINRFPPLLCTSIDSNATFYAFVIPIILMLDIGLALLILMVWIVQKQSKNINTNQNHHPLKIGTAEKKLLVIIIYYVILAVMALTTFTLFSRTLSLFTQRLLEYFLCEKNGLIPGVTSCDTSTFQDLTHPIPANMSYVLIAVSPWLYLIFALNVKELKEKLCPFIQRTKSQLNQLSNNSNSTTPSFAA